MSCLDVMYHQSCGAHYLPAAYKAAYYGHHHQRKPSAYSKVQECVEQQMHQHHHHHQQQQQQLQQSRAAGMLPRDQGLRRASLPPGSRCSVSSSASGGSREDCVLTKDSCGQPAEAEYLSARCVLFTYFQGSIGDVVDEHFSRALGQSGAFARETKPVLRVTQQQQQQQPSPPLPGALWKDGASLSEGPIMNMWTSGAYPSQAGPFLPATSSTTSSTTSSSSITIHPDFPCTVSPLPFLPADGALWPGHALAPDPHSAWSYGLSAGQAGAPVGGYPQLHDLYAHHHPASVHHHPHHHAGRFPHAHPLHSFPSHGVTGPVDPRLGPVLLPGVRQRTSCAEGQGSPPPLPLPPRPLSEEVKTEMDPGVTVSVATASTLPASWSPASLHGSLEVYDSGLNQEKAKAWF